MAGAGAVVARILTQYSDKGSKAAQKDIARLEKKINAFSKKALKSFAVAGAASAAYAVKLGVDSVKAATEDAKSQALLANSLKNVTGATDATIAKVEEYISKQQLASNVTDTELRLSLSKLATATGDVNTAMDLQSVALDTAAGTTKDLSVVSDALSKAANGNFTALQKLVPSLDKNIIKNKDLGGALLALDKAYGGAAKTAAKSDPFKRLQIIFGELSETIGYALLPAAIEFASYIESDIIPLVESWASANKDKLDDSLRGVMGNIKDLVDALQDIYKVIEGINRLLPLGIGGWLKLAVAVSGLTSAISGFVVINRALKNTKMFYAATRGSTQTVKELQKQFGFFRGIVAKFSAFISFAIKRLVTFFGKFSLVTKIAKFAVGLNPWIKAALLLAGALGWAAKRFDWFGKSAAKLSPKAQAIEDNISKTTKGVTSMDQALAAYKKTQETNTKLTQEQIDRNKRLAAITARNTAADKAAAAEAAKVAKAKAAILKLSGLTVTNEDDPIQLEAARINLVKQGNLAEAARVAAMAKNLEVQLEANKALARYNDLLAALADKEISSEEVLLLSKKWDMTIEATQSYIQTLLAVADQQISDDEVVNLAKAWGSSKDQAARYLDFFNYLNDGKLSDAEIAKLQTKWGLTSKEVQVYADLITKASDYVLSDVEIETLKKNWGLTTEEVVAYIKKLGQPVTFSGTLIDPATQATLGWKNALAALLAYQAALAGKAISTTTTTPPVVTPPPVVNPPASGDNVYDALQRFKAKEAADAAADAAAKAATDAAIAAAAANPNVPNYYASQESGAIGAASIAAKQAEAARLAALEKQSAQADAYAAGMAARYGGFVGSSTLSNASSITPSATAATNITINVAGSVTTEQDLVNTVRTGLLNGQYNGKSILLEAI